MLVVLRCSPGFSCLNVRRIVLVVDSRRNQAPRPKGRGMNCASPNSRSSTGLRRERRGIRPTEIEAGVLDADQVRTHFGTGKRSGALSEADDRAGKSTGSDEKTGIRSPNSRLHLDERRSGWRYDDQRVIRRLSSASAQTLAVVVRRPGGLLQHFFWQLISVRPCMSGQYGVCRNGLKPYEKGNHRTRTRSNRYLG